ncbi:uncharacterized protein LOC141535275 [Cotesia typhae]|uniref:uncharacterized protein LOC141535275 n=1 Tax=Cotesia typhae TaxID=2053667 RepID=UPI003D68CE07
MDSQQKVFLSLAIMRLTDETKISLVKFVQGLEPSVQIDGEFNLWAYQQSTLDEIRKFVEDVFKKTPNEVLSEEELKKQLQDNQETLAVIRSSLPTCFLFKDEHKNSHSISGSNSDSNDSSSDNSSDDSSSAAAAAAVVVVAAAAAVPNKKMKKKKKKKKIKQTFNLTVALVAAPVLTMQKLIKPKKI